MWNKVSRQKWRNLDTISRKKDEEVTMDWKNAAEQEKGKGREIHRRWFVTVTGCRVCMGKKEHLETAWPRPAFFKVRGPDSYRAQEASENPCLAQPRETRHALFRRLCACCSSAVFTYVVPMYIRRACARWRHYARRGEEDTRHASLHARRGRTPDTGQLHCGDRATTRAIHPRVHIPRVDVPWTPTHRFTDAYRLATPLFNPNFSTLVANVSFVDGEIGSF